MKKLPLDYIKTFGSTVGDDQFAKVTAMFNFDGSDGDTTTSRFGRSNGYGFWELKKTKRKCNKS